jgi:hypothetical protein
MIALADKIDCCGCGACDNACPESCISMCPDVSGFLYPRIEKEYCIQCGLCVAACPVLNPVARNSSIKSAYVVQHKDDDIRRQSTSGGVFTAIAEFVISQGGVVFGAAFDDEYQVHHIHVERSDELKLFRSSKYVQSIIGNTYKEAKTFLDTGRMVCFSGTPCQICGLKSFLGREYDHLVTVDFMCRAVPSPLVFKKYLELQQRKLGEILNLRFRDKCYGYSYSTLTIQYRKNNKYHQYNRGIESDLWLRAFFSGICDRPCCKDCRFQKGIHQSDFTIWDCVNVWKYVPEYDDNLGSSRMLIQSEKGYSFFKNIKHSIRFTELPSSKIIEKEKKRYHELSPVKEDIFYSDVHKLDPLIFFRKYFPYTIKVALLHAARVTTYRLGIYGILKKYVWNILRR